MNATFADILVWGGAALTLAGLALLMWCILKVARLKRSGATDTELTDALQSVVPANLGGLCLSAMGLIMVVVGLVLS